MITTFFVRSEYITARGGELYMHIHVSEGGLSMQLENVFNSVSR
jgi:hypothetical protein